MAAVVIAFGVYSAALPGRRIRVPVPGPGSALTAVGTILALFVIGAPAVAIWAVGGASVFIAPALARMRSSRIAAEVRGQWPDFLAIVRSRIGSGEPLPDAVRAAARSLGGPFDDLDRAWGGSFGTELEATRIRWGDPIADRVLTTLRVASSTGGAHVDAVLSSLTTSLSGEMRIRSAHDAALTQQRLTAGVALVAPWIILALSLATNPQAGREFATPTGRMILVGGGVATVGGYLLARHAARLARPVRVFG